MAQAPPRRLRCDYKRLCALKGLERLRQLVPNDTPQDEVKVIIDAMFYLTQLEVKAEQLKKALRKARPRDAAQSGPPATATAGSSSSALNEESQMPDPQNLGHFPEDLLDLDDSELKELHSEMREPDATSIASGADDLPIPIEKTETSEIVLES